MVPEVHLLFMTPPSTPSGVVENLQSINRLTYYAALSDLPPLTQALGTHTSWNTYPISQNQGDMNGQKPRMWEKVLLK